MLKKKKHLERFTASLVFSKPNKDQKSSWLLLTIKPRTLLWLGQFLFSHFLQDPRISTRNRLVIIDQKSHAHDPS